MSTLGPPGSAPAAAEAAEAAEADAAAAWPRRFGVMRTPLSSIEICTSTPLPSSALALALARGGRGGAGTSTISGRSVMTSVIVQRNGGSFCRIEAPINSRIPSSTKRFQLMPTSQFA